MGGGGGESQAGCMSLKGQKVEVAKKGRGSPGGLEGGEGAKSRREGRGAVYQLSATASE